MFGRSNMTKGTLGLTLEESVKEVQMWMSSGGVHLNPDHIQRIIKEAGGSDKSEVFQEATDDLATYAATISAEASDLAMASYSASQSQQGAN